MFKRTNPRKHRRRPSKNSVSPTTKPQVDAVFSHGAPSHVAPPPSSKGRHIGQPAPLAGTVLESAPYFPDDTTRVLRRAQADTEQTAVMPIVRPDMASHVYPLLNPFDATPTGGRPSADADLAGVPRRVAAPLRRLHSGADEPWFAPDGSAPTTLRDFHSGFPVARFTPAGGGPFTLEFTLVGDPGFNTRRAGR